MGPRGAAGLDRPRVLHLDVGLQHVRRLDLLVGDGGCVLAGAEQAAVWLHRRRRTIGGIAGAGVTLWLVGPIGAASLLLVSAVLLEVAALAARRLFAQPRTATARRRRRGRRATGPERAIGGIGLGRHAAGLTDPFLLNVTLNMPFFTVLTTFLYFQQATIVDAAITDRAERTRFFANIDLAVNVDSTL